MTNTDADCQHCGATTQGTLCAKCTRKLATTLGELPALLAELETTVQRQDRIESSTRPVYGRRDIDPHALDAADRLQAAIPAALRSRQGLSALPSTPWAFAPDSADILTGARATLLRWAKVINATIGAPRPTTPRADLRSQDRAICTWLIEHRNDIAQNDLAGELFTSIMFQRGRVERAVDRTDPDIFLGLCDAAAIRCGAELYATPEMKDVTCPNCGWLYGVKARKDKLLDIVYDEVRPVRDVADAVSGFLTDERGESVTCTQSMVRNLVSRGRLSYRGGTMLRVGDVVDLMRAQMERDKARRARRPKRVSA